MKLHGEGLPNEVIALRLAHLIGSKDRTRELLRDLLERRGLQRNPSEDTGSLKTSTLRRAAERKRKAGR